MLIRHAEKPVGENPGIDRQGRPDAASLSVDGWLRAGALLPFFAPHDVQRQPPQILRPKYIFAARPTEAHPSTRPRDTVAPLAALLGVTVDERWSDEDDATEIGSTLRGLDGPALVCWRHAALPALANEILQRPDAPARWPETRFDLVWIVEQRSFSWSFAQVAQRLLPGDEAHTVAKRLASKAKRPAAPG